ncbi:FYN-binding protein 1 [Echeneis naucrates]|uniref:FYN-binding protein 1 n=1 Tax=Echeneis naucrates TaxID=173247 RepID=UPI0011143BA8|nr:FYN-binding protein 1-like [Echeneis naucrates]
MDQENTIDFKALRAKFQDEELFLKQPKNKPALPEKPKVVPPPQSPTHYVPAGARPSLLTSINQSVESKTLFAPKVVFKTEKESKQPLIQTNSKGKDKSEGKLKLSEDWIKGNKQKPWDLSNQKQKKEDSKGNKPESTAELVQALPPPKTPKKKSFLSLRKFHKKDSVAVQADSILDTPTSDLPELAPLIPVPPDFSDTPPEPEISAPKALQPSISAIPEITPPFIIPAFPDFTPPPAFIPDNPVQAPNPETETPLETETPALSVSRPTTHQNEIIPNRADSPPQPETAAEGGAALLVAEVERSQVAGPPKSEHQISPLSALERAEDMSPGKRNPPADQRILTALEKVCKRSASPVINSTPPYSFTPPPEDFPLPESPTQSFPELPPIDYEDRAGIARSVKPEEVNSINHRQASPASGDVTEVAPDAVPELLVVPPPTSKKVFPSHKPLGPAPEQSAGPLPVNLSEINPPPMDDNDTIDIPQFDLALDASNPDMPVSDWGNGEDTQDGQDPPSFSSNGIATTETDIKDYPPSVSPFPVSQGYPPMAGPEAELGDGLYENTDNIYEDISTSSTKKKGKTDAGKKRKGPPKNPYVESQQELNEEKSRTGRFSKGDKKAATEGLDEKEMKKREKQRLEKEKKELKERQEREKKEQREREKKESEMKKRFKLTGQEDAMYRAKVTVTTKGRKNDLPVKCDDIVSIIRTTNCPKGKWLARDSNSNYGYVAVDHVELDIKEMLELGKKAANNRKASSNNIIDGEVPRTNSRASNHYPQSAESFTDSDEWTGDEETLSPPRDIADPFPPGGHTRTLSMPDMGSKDLSINHQHTHSDLIADNSQLQARHEALQKLATFFHSPIPVAPAPSNAEQETSHALEKEEALHLPEASVTQDVDFEHPDLLILPPPDLYADLTTE